MSGYQFWERKRIKAAEGKLRVFWQMEEDVVPARPRVSTGHPTHPTAATAPALLGLGASAGPGSGTSSGSGGMGLGWAVLGRPSCFQLGDKDAGPTSPSVHRLRASPSRSRAQLHIRECGPGAGHSSPFPGLVDLRGDAPWCPNAQRRVRNGISVAVTFPAAVPSPHSEALAGPTWMLHRQGWRAAFSGAHAPPRRVSKGTDPQTANQSLWLLLSQVAPGTALTNPLGAWQPCSQKGLVPRNPRWLGGDSHTHGTGRAPSLQCSQLRRREGIAPPDRCGSGVSPLWPLWEDGGSSSNISTPQTSLALQEALALPPMPAWVTGAPVKHGQGDMASVTLFPAAALSPPLLPPLPFFHLFVHSFFIRHNCP